MTILLFFENVQYKPIVNKKSKSKAYVLMLRMAGAFCSIKYYHCYNK